MICFPDLVAQAEFAVACYNSYFLGAFPREGWQWLSSNWNSIKGNFSAFFLVKRDVQENDEEAVQVKEQSILELGSLLAKTGQAEGEPEMSNWDIGWEVCMWKRTQSTQVMG